MNFVSIVKSYFVLFILLEITLCEIKFHFIFGVEFKKSPLQGS